jgi:hypothetical protein
MVAVGSGVGVGWIDGEGDDEKRVNPMKIIIKRRIIANPKSKYIPLFILLF